MAGFKKPDLCPIDKYLDERDHRLDIEELRKRQSNTFLVARFVLEKEVHPTFNTLENSVNQIIKLLTVSAPQNGISTIRFTLPEELDNKEPVRHLAIGKSGLLPTGAFIYKTCYDLEVPTHEGYLQPIEAKLDDTVESILNTAQNTATRL